MSAQNIFNGVIVGAIGLLLIIVLLVVFGG